MFSSIAQIKAEGNLPDSIDDKILEPHKVKAIIEVKKIISPEKYTEIEALGTDHEDFIICAIAEANLALAYAIPSLNMETQGTGIVKTKGWEHSRSDLLSQNEVYELKEYYRNVAMNLLKPFIPQVSSTDDKQANEIRGAEWGLSAL